MQTIRHFFRLLYIQYVLAKHGLDRIVVTIPWLTPIRFVVFLNPWNWFRDQEFDRGVALRLALEELGPVFVKFGQALSTRPDILPVDIICELKKLQDQVPPFDSNIALKILQKAYGCSVFEVFARFDVTPLASASMAQVNTAQLKTGEEVVVKVLRPGMRKIIKSDLGILRTLAKLAERYWKYSRRFKPCEIVDEFEYSLLSELNLQLEAANASQLRRNFINSDLLYVPKVFWDYVRQSVLVTERIHGIPVDDIDSIIHHGINLKILAERGVEIFFTQVFRDQFFHADMHPGNIFVSYQNPMSPQFMCVDFGIIGTLSEYDKRYIAENLYAFFKRDYRRVALLHVESGWVARDTRVEEFEMAIRMVCEPIFAKPLKDVSFAMVVLNLFQIARRFQMEVQPQLVLLQKTLLAIEGLGRRLYPELDIASCAQPFLEKWLKQQVSPINWLRHIKDNVPFFIEQLPHMPKLTFEVLSLLKEQKLALQSPTSKVTQKNSGFGFALGWVSVSTLLVVSEYLQWPSSNNRLFGAVLLVVMGGFFLLKRAMPRGD